MNCVHLMLTNAHRPRQPTLKQTKRPSWQLSLVQQKLQQQLLQPVHSKLVSSGLKLKRSIQAICYIAGSVLGG